MNSSTSAPVVVLARSAACRERLALHVAACSLRRMPVGSPVGGSFSILPGPVGDLEILVDAAQLQRQRIERGVGAGGEEDRVLRRGLVELRLGRIALLLAAG